MEQAIQGPRLPKRLPAQSIERLEDYKEYTGCSFVGHDLSGQTASEILFEQVHLRRVVLSHTHLTKVRLVDTRAEICDWSGASWEKVRCRWAEFVECRLLGLQWFEADLEYVLFKDCNLEGAVFVTSMFRIVRFDKCSLRGARLEESDLTGTVFHQCDLTDASLQGSKLEGVDLRGSILNGLKVSSKELKGVIIEPIQAIQVVSLIGIKVMDEEGRAADGE